MQRLIGRIRRDEAGFGIVEVMVAILLLGIIAIAFLPVILNSLRQSSGNTSTTAGVQLLNDQMERARVQSKKCSDLTTWAGIPAASDASRTVTDSRGVTMTASITVACPTTYPGTARVTVIVKRPDGTTVADAITRVAVTSAS